MFASREREVGTEACVYVFDERHETPESGVARTKGPSRDCQRNSNDNYLQFT